MTENRTPKGARDEAHAEVSDHPEHGTSIKSSATGEGTSLAAGGEIHAETLTHSGPLAVAARQSISLKPGITQDEFRTEIKSALVAVTQNIDQLDQTTHDALHQFLRMVREVQVDGKKLEDVRNMVEDLWVKEASKELKTGKGIKDILQTILNSPILKVILEKGFLDSGG